MPAQWGAKSRSLAVAQQSLPIWQEKCCFCKKVLLCCGSEEVCARKKHRGFTHKVCIQISVVLQGREALHPSIAGEVAGLGEHHCPFFCSLEKVPLLLRGSFDHQDLLVPGLLPALSGSEFPREQDPRVKLLLQGNPLGGGGLDGSV